MTAVILYRYGNSQTVYSFLTLALNQSTNYAIVMLGSIPHNIHVNFVSRMCFAIFVSFM